MLLKLKLATVAFLAPLVAVLTMRNAHGSAEDVADKWLRNIQNAQQEMQAGVARVTVSPGQAAAAKKQKWVNSLMDTNTQDKWARNVASVSLQQWQQAMNDYGINRVAQGAQAKKQKFVNIMGPLLQYIDNVSNQVRSMPDNTYADREQRALAMMRGMRNFRRPSGA